jgi:hypothetical protein
LVWFVGDSGYGNRLYRPLHSFFLWLVYRVFGEAPRLNMFVNVTLHVAVCLVLLRILMRTCRNPFVALIFTGLCLASIYTYYAPTTICDRQALGVALPLILLVDHFTVRTRSPKADLCVPYVVFLSLAGLMSKENGLIIPALAFLFSFSKGLSGPGGLKLRIASLAVMISYLAFRQYILGYIYSAYWETGSFLGFLNYNEEIFNSYPRIIQCIIFLDNIVKNALATFIPIFGNIGEITLSPFPVLAIASLILTMAAVILSIDSRISELQLYAIAIILLNAVIHYMIFRYRTLYIAQIGFCIFLGASRCQQTHARRPLIIRASAMLLLGCNIARILL